MKTIAFINPPGPSKLYRSLVCTYISKANYLWQPQDFINLSAHIPPDYKLKLFDCSVNGMDAQGLFEEIRECKPVLVIVALSSIVFDHDLDFLKSFTQSFPEITCLVSGDVLLEDIFWEQIFEYADGLILNTLDIDLTRYILHGESHSANLILKNACIQKRDPYAEPKKVSIGIPRHELFLNRTYRFPFVQSFLYSTVSSQFGCPYRCLYCATSKIPVTYRDAQEVLAEIEYVRSLGVRDMFFADPSFGFPQENVRQIVKGMIDKEFSMRWVCYTNPLLLDREFLALMKKAGCHTVIIGVDDEDTEMLKKQYSRTLSKARLIEFCEACQRLKIRVCGDFIIGLNSHEEAVNRMVRFARKLQLDYASFNIFIVLPGSFVREELVKTGKFDPHTVGADTSGTFGRDEKLIRLRNLAVKKFYLRPGYLWHRLISIRSLPELRIQVKEMVVMLKNMIQSIREKS